MQRLFRMYPDFRRCLALLTQRQKALVVSAVNYHTLVWPEKLLTFQIYLGKEWQYPRLTDASTMDGSLTAKVGLHPVASFSASGSRFGRDKNDMSVFDRVSGVAIRNEESDGIRYILLTPDDATDESCHQHQVTERLPVRIYKAFELRAPIGFDYVRELLRRMAERRNNRSIPRPEVSVVAGQRIAGEEVNKDCADSVLSLPHLQRRRAVIIAMYWLQSGGAEQWGLETIRLAEQAGIVPIVITDRDSQQPWITGVACGAALVLPLSRPIEPHPGAVPVLDALYERYDIRGILIHHCQWMYDQLSWVKRTHPETYVVDSLHILEYVMRGGFPRQAVLHDQWIDLHHVISPQLEHWMVRVHNIPADKVVDAPLIGLTANSAALRYKERGSASPFVVSFIGRMARQKRPEAFILLARYLENKRPGAFRFIMHGSGEMDGFVDRLIHRYHLEQVIERRSGAAPVARTYGDGDALVVSSINEGITLTTIEAISAGVPVLSADVGSQGTLVPPVGLLPRLTASFVSSAAKALMRMADREPDRRRLWEDEARRLVEFSKLQSADALFSKLFEQWSK